MILSFYLVYIINYMSMSKYTLNHCDECKGIEIEKEACRSSRYLSGLGMTLKFECLRELAIGSKYIERNDLYCLMEDNGTFDALKDSLEHGFNVGMAILSIHVHKHPEEYVDFILDNYILDDEAFHEMFNDYNTDKHGIAFIEKTCNYMLEHKEKYPNGLPWTSKMINMVVQDHKNLTLLKYMIENGCPVDEMACISAIKHGCANNLKYLCSLGTIPGSDKYLTLSEAM